jgi:hypothetical protein
MRKADTINLIKLRTAWPQVYASYMDRYDSDGGLAKGEAIITVEAMRSYCKEPEGHEFEEYGTNAGKSRVYHYCKKCSKLKRIE